MVIIGALVGAPLRYLIDRGVRARHGTALPWGTFVVNLIACAGLGFLTGATAAVPVAVQHLLGPGLCATLSTYSTFSADTLRLARSGGTLLAAGKAIASVLIGLTAAVLSSALAHALVT